MKFFIQTLGCKVNQYDSLILSKKLRKFGFLFSEENPDVVIVNTCAVTKIAIRKDKKMIRNLQKKFPNAKFVIMGCWTKTYGGKNDLNNIAMVEGVGKLDFLAKKICNLCGLTGKKKQEVKIDSPESGGHSRYFLKIQDGCEQFCSYCNIPFARGMLKSRGEKDIIREVKKVSCAGFNEIVLCGIHLGLYGKEKNSKTCNLVSLLKKIIGIELLGRIRLSSIEVNDVSDELLKLMRRSNKICWHLHLPLQSGNDKILKLMNRPYRKKDFEIVVEKARRLMPGIAITTDIIVGFPSETEKDFQKSVDFVEKIKFSRLHVFPFSSHEKTLAASMDNQIDQKTKKDRTKKLRLVGETLRSEYNRSFKNKKLQIVIEAIKGKKINGKSQYYFDVEFLLDKDIGNFEEAIGKTVTVDLRHARIL